MLRDTNAYGGGGLPERKTPQGMWSPDEEPHRTARTKARPTPCNGECRDTCFGNDDGCTWCDYTPQT